MAQAGADVAANGTSPSRCETRPKRSLASGGERCADFDVTATPVSSDLYSQYAIEFGSVQILVIVAGRTETNAYAGIPEPE